MPTKTTPCVLPSRSGWLRSRLLGVEAHPGEGVDVVPVNTPKSSGDEVVQGELGAHGPGLPPGLSPRLKFTEILADAAAYLNILFLIQSIVVD